MPQISESFPLQMVFIMRPENINANAAYHGAAHRGAKRDTDVKRHGFHRARILISHDLDYVAKYADHVVLLDKTVAKQGTVKEVFESKEFERIFYTGEESWVREEEHK